MSLTCPLSRLMHTEFCNAKPYAKSFFSVQRLKKSSSSLEYRPCFACIRACRTCKVRKHERVKSDLTQIRTCLTDAVVLLGSPQTSPTGRLQNRPKSLVLHLQERQKSSANANLNLPMPPRNAIPLFHSTPVYLKPTGP